MKPGWHGPVLGLVVVGGAALRFWGIDFGLPHTQCRPDESTLVHKALAIGAGDPNPHFFNYPSFHFYVLAGLYGLYWLAGWVGGAWDGAAAFAAHFFFDPSPFYLIGRCLSAALSSLSLLLVYRLGCGLGGRRAGLLAAFFLAVSFLHGREAHFLTVDTPATFYALAALVCAGRYIECGRRSDWLVAVVLFGLAASTKYNAVLLAAGLVPAAWSRERPWQRLAEAAALMPAAFVCASPFIVLDFPAFWRDLSFERGHFAGGHGVDLGRGWGYHLYFTLWHGMGWPLLLASLGGCVWVWRRRSPYGAMLLVAVLAYYGVAGSGKTVFMRYMLPVVPLLCLLAAGATAWAGRRWKVIWLVLLALALAGPSLMRGVRHGDLLAQPDTRLLAAAWIEENVPSGATVALSGSEYGHPRLHPSPEWLRQRLADVQRVGLGGRRLQRMLALPAYPPQPYYNLITLKPRGEVALASVWPDASVEELQARGVGWLVVQSHPLIPPGPLDTQWGALEPLVHFSGGATAEAAFDRQDAYYVPVAGLAGVERPGPDLRVYRLALEGEAE